MNGEQQQKKRWKNKTNKECETEDEVESLRELLKNENWITVS